MKIQIDRHTIDRATERGTNEAEIVETLNSGIFNTVKYGRFSKTKVFHHNKTRNGKYYKQKKVEIIYVIEYDIIVAVTAYVFYGEWEGNR